MNESKVKTIVGQAKGYGTSLKTTIPKSMVEILKIEKGDIIAWNHDIKDNKIVVCIEPVKLESK